MPRKHPRPPWAGHAPPPTLPGAAPRALGIDIGRVIISDVEGGDDTSFLGSSEAEAMRTPPARGSLETIAALVEAFEGRVWLVSKCGPAVQARTRRWLEIKRFHARTGLPAAQVRFCRQRHEKAPICASLGLQAFIDDRPDVLAAMVGVVPWRYLFGPQRRPVPADVTWVRDWEAVAAQLLPLADEAARVTATAPGTAAERPR